MQHKSPPLGASLGAVEFVMGLTIAMVLVMWIYAGCMSS
jgi:hypothetical protein